MGGSTSVGVENSLLSTGPRVFVPGLMAAEVENMVPSAAMMPTAARWLNSGLEIEEITGPRVCVPALLDDELEVMVPNAASWPRDQRHRSSFKIVGMFRFQLWVYPNGRGADGYHDHVSAFIHVCPLHGWQGQVFVSTKFNITVVNWWDYNDSAMIYSVGTFSEQQDRLGDKLLQIDKLTQSRGWLKPDGAICFRARCWF